MYSGDESVEVCFGGDASLETKQLRSLQVNSRDGANAASHTNGRAALAFSSSSIYHPRDQFSDNICAIPRPGPRPDGHGRTVTRSPHRCFLGAHKETIHRHPRFGVVGNDRDAIATRGTTQTSTRGNHALPPLNQPKPGIHRFARNRHVDPHSCAPVPFRLWVSTTSRALPPLSTINTSPGFPVPQFCLPRLTAGVERDQCLEI